ncbi:MULTISPECIES: hypothetical protein [unclassified Nocardiopsis]|uniref:hypothetical protein n=1 Tax=Nocardiopsis TaxID=2013 RepID=UPI00387B3B9C
MRRAFLKVAAVITGALTISLATSTATLAEEAYTSVEEIEILITDDGEVLTVGEGEDVESIEAYQAQLADETGIRPFGTEYGYSSNGTLRIQSNSAATSIDYFKDAGSSIKVEFRNYYSSNRGTGWSCPQTIGSGGRGGCGARHPSWAGSARVRGEMRVVGTSTIIRTKYTTQA